MRQPAVVLKGDITWVGNYKSYWGIVEVKQRAKDKWQILYITSVTPNEYKYQEISLLGFRYIRFRESKL